MHPPSAEYLVDVIVLLIGDNEHYENQDQKNKYYRLSKHLQHHKPDKQWLLGLLSTMNVNHEIF